MGNTVKDGQPNHYLFVIDTNRYAGNFEREMCAYITGQIGECEVGEEQAKLAKQEIPEVVAKLEELIESVPDEHGCHRPCSIFPTPGWFNHGMGGHFQEGQETEALVHYKKEVKKYYESQIKRTKLIKAGTNGWSKEAKIREIQECQDEIDEANSMNIVSKHPAYMSVAIYFNSKPSSRLLDIMKKRARNIAKRGIGLEGYEQKIEIEGFRLLTQQTQSTVESV